MKLEACEVEYAMSHGKSAVYRAVVTRFKGRNGKYISRNLDQ